MNGSDARRGPRRARAGYQRALLGLALLALGTSACDDPQQPARSPQQQAGRGRRGAKRGQGSKPAKRSADFPLHVDVGPFLAAGCTEVEEGELDCAAAAFVREFGCEPKVRVDDMLGGLAPLVAIAECRVPGVKAPAGLAEVGCKSPVARELVAWREGKFELYDRPESFRKAFGPVKSADAALGFALAMSAHTHVLREVAFDDEAPVTPDIMPTNVLLRQQGYIVRLFDTEPCGCAHGDYADDFLVTLEGEVKPIARVLVHTDPNTAGHCEEGSRSGAP